MHNAKMLTYPETGTEKWFPRGRARINYALSMVLSMHKKSPIDKIMSHIAKIMPRISSANDNFWNLLIQGMRCTSAKHKIFNSQLVVRLLPTNFWLWLRRKML